MTEQRTTEEKVYVCRWRYVPPSIPEEGVVTVRAKTLTDAINTAKDVVFPEKHHGSYASDVEILSVEIVRD